VQALGQADREADALAGSGLDFIRAVTAKAAAFHVVVETIYDDDKNLFSALRCGARGYILKDQDKDKIVSD
jgi:DNA-binding NarL/FixJ family response regulator|tara:strand:- start:843 stop:1055 length:213 start_codon:yes stop_codon:yes gene_type:complete